MLRTVGQHGSFGTSPFELHVGLGTAERVAKVEVLWPRTGATQTFTDLAAGTRVRIVEGEAEPVVESVRPRQFPR